MRRRKERGGQFKLQHKSPTPTLILLSRSVNPMMDLFANHRSLHSTVLLSGFSFSGFHIMKTREGQLIACLFHSENALLVVLLLVPFHSHLELWKLACSTTSIMHCFNYDGWNPKKDIAQFCLI
jgi:hypothetical protein